MNELNASDSTPEEWFAKLLINHVVLVTHPEDKIFTGIKLRRRVLDLFLEVTRTNATGIKFREALDEVQCFALLKV